MARWIAFDSATADVLKQRQETFSSLEVRTGDALDAALTSDAPCVVVMPALDGNLLVITRRPATQQVDRAPQFVATGFLGLEDAPAEDEPPAPRKWWRRLLD